MTSRLVAVALDCRDPETLARSGAPHSATGCASGGPMRRAPATSRPGAMTVQCCSSSRCARTRRCRTGCISTSPRCRAARPTRSPGWSGSEPACSTTAPCCPGWCWPIPRATSSASARHPGKDEELRCSGTAQVLVATTCRACRASSRASLPDRASSAAASGWSRSRARTERSGATASIADLAMRSPRGSPVCT